MKDSVSKFYHVGLRRILWGHAIDNNNINENIHVSFANYPLQHCVLVYTKKTTSCLFLIFQMHFFYVPIFTVKIYA